MLDKAVSYTIISEKFGIGHSTFGDIKRIAIKYNLLRREERGMKEEIKSMKLGALIKQFIRKALAFLCRVELA